MLALCRIMHPSLLLALLPGLTFAQSSDPSFLGDSLLRQNQVQNVLEHQPASAAECKHVPTGPIEMTQCTYESLESTTEDLYKNLHELVTTPFFRYFRADLYRECPFWTESGMCSNRECGITTLDESEIPEKWRAASLSKVELPPEELRHSLPGCYYKESDYCFLDDHTEGEHIDLIANPEQFTGYAGFPANRIWSTIYNENCFGITESDLKRSESGDSSASSSSSTLSVKTPGESEQCLEKRVYYKVISGLHASISIHLCHDWFNQTSGQWMPNLECFVSRVASHPERLKYVYFDNVLLLRAVARLGPYLSAYDYCSCNSETHEEDKFTTDRLAKVIDISKNVGQFDESVLFKGEDANLVKEEFKAHFRNVSRIMDCVGCDKCRLWGKIQTTGVATALKVLFELDEKALDPSQNRNLLTRSEVVALINTLHRLTESLVYVTDFRKMWAEAPDEESQKLIHEAEKALTDSVSSFQKVVYTWKLTSFKPQITPSRDPLHLRTEGTPETLSQRDLYILWKRRFWHFVSLCRQCTTDCFNTCKRVVDSVFELILSSFQSFKGDKRAPPHSDL